jgi:hypothetical protein
MFKPNVPCSISRADGKHDLYGKSTPKEVAKERCAIIKMTNLAQHSSVRQDTSPSRGSAMQLESDATLAFLPTTVLELDDVISVAGFQLRVRGKSPKYSLQGTLDYYLVETIVWSPT